MNILIQLWETIDQDNQIESDGCSLHIDLDSRNFYINNEIRENNERFVGLPSEVKTKDSIYEILKIEKSIRLSEIEMNNLLGLKEIEPIND